MTKSNPIAILTNFGVDLTRPPPAAASSLRHAHAKQV